ncbi:MAG: class I SAM-dependent methyltransferase [Acidimicrobiia bacterium]
MADLYPPAGDGADDVFTLWPAAAEVPLDVVHYGPDIATESDLRLLGNIDGKRVLELGCGAGPVSVAMAKRGARVTALDASIDQVSRARWLAEREEVRIEFRHGDPADLAFARADTFDMALSVYSLDIVSDLDRVFRQVHRVLRPEAAFVVSLPHPMYAAIEPDGNPPRMRRSYFDHEPVPGVAGERRVQRYPRTVAGLWSAFARANFRVDTLLEPEPVRSGARSRHWTNAQAWVPSTLVIRARKLGI